MVSWSSRLWHLLNTQNVPSSILGEIIYFFKFLFLKRLELNNADKYYIVMLYWSLLFSSASSQCLIFIVLRMRIRLSIGFFISNTSEPL